MGSSRSRGLLVRDPKSLIGVARVSAPTRWFMNLPWMYPVWLPLTRWRSRRPATFTEKIRYKLARDRRPYLHDTADRVALRNLVLERLGPGFLPDLYAVTWDAARIDWSRIPREHVCKVAHGWRGAILVADDAPADAQLPTSRHHPGWVRFEVQPELGLPERKTRILSAWQRSVYGAGRWDYQWAYHRVPRRVLVEELLRDGNGRRPQEWSAFVFDGRCGLVRGRSLTSSGGVMFEPGGEVASFQYCKDSPVRWEFPTGAAGPPIPEADWRRLITTAEAIGRGTDFVRVDLYQLDDRVVVGELSHYPGNGRLRFCPPGGDLELGQRWHVPRRYR